MDAMSYDCSKPARAYFCGQRSIQRVSGGPWVNASHKGIVGLVENEAHCLMPGAPFASLSGSGSPVRACGDCIRYWNDAQSVSGDP